jgi:YHS domain-containing protein
MTRLLLFIVLSIVISRILSRIFSSFADGYSGRDSRQAGTTPQRGVHMVRDPVCGTFLLPDHAVTIVDGRSRVYFCSDACRDKYRARTA